VSAIAVPLPRRRPGVGTIYAWELRKLRAQKRTYIGLGAAVLVPLVFIFALLTSNGGPEEIPFGRYVRDSGLAIPLVAMFFGSIWFFPLVTALVSGDIVAAEDGNGTLKTILTRSAERWQIFAAKVLAALSYTFAALLLYMLVGLVIGGLVYGFNPLVSLSGTHISVGRGLALTAAGGLAYFVPMVAVASIALMLSTLSRNSAAAVVGTLMISLIMQLLGAINALSFLHPYLLSEQFNAWQGFLREPIDWAPIGHAAWVAAAYAIPALTVSFIAFLRRDVTGG
jgi:ABC-2 type transport system permease protein